MHPLASGSKFTLLPPSPNAVFSPSVRQNLLVLTSRTDSWPALLFRCIRTLLVQASPNDHIAAPSNTTSFNRNCPGRAESEGNPPRLGSHPGVESKKESVVRNMSTAPPLPSADALVDQCRRPIKIAIATSTTPSARENARSVRKPYIQPINGLFATRGCIPFASYSVNFIRPIQPITKTRP